MQISTFSKMCREVLFRITIKRLQAEANDFVLTHLYVLMCNLHDDHLLSPGFFQQQCRNVLELVLT